MTTARTRFVDPRQLVIPEVRVTNYMADEVLEQFDSSVSEAGVLQPPLVINNNGQLVVVDGANRVRAAIAKGITKVQVVVREGSLADAVLQNLATGFLHGRPRAQDVLAVVKMLVEDEGLDSDQIAKATGMTRNYIEDMVLLYRGDELVLQAWSEERIGKAHAQLLNAIGDEDRRRRLLEMQLLYNWTSKELQEMVSEAEKVAAEPAADEPLRTEPHVAMARCYLTDEDVPAESIKMLPFSQEGIELLVAFKQELSRSAAAAGEP